MKKIMFDDRYGLESASLDGTKNMPSYNYQTGQAVLGFVLKRVEGHCNISGANRPIGVFCFGCKHYKGKRGKFVFCEYHDKDDPGSSDLRDDLVEELRTEALCALCH